MSRPSPLIISQVYVPDPASVGQHLHDAAAEMAARGYPVRVLTSARGYETPELCFPRREVRDGVGIVRFGLGSFGKRSILVRLIGQLVFLVRALLYGLTLERLGGILVSTSRHVRCGGLAAFYGAAASAGPVLGANYRPRSTHGSGGRVAEVVVGPRYWRAEWCAVGPGCHNN